MLLPPDLREWVPENDMVHFVLNAVEAVPLTAFKINHRGCGDAQYPPRMMLALLIYCYANGIFGSRRIERATWRDIGIRYLTADTHPDHDTICKYRRENFDAIAEAFLRVLLLARELGVLKVGTVSVDGTHIQANASIGKSLRYDRAKVLEARLSEDIAELMSQAEQSDTRDDNDGQSLPDEIKRRETLREKMRQAQANLERRAKARAEAQQSEYQRKLSQREQRDGKRKGQKPKPPKDTPSGHDKTNLTDADSRIMRKSKRSEYRQAYNAQVAVDADGSQLILSRHVTNCAADANELKPAIENIPDVLGKPETALADSGYMNSDAFEDLEAAGVDLYVSVDAEDSHAQRRYDYRPPKQKKTRTLTVAALLAMREKVATEEGRRKYAKRKSTVEPVFGIIKSVMGFRQFLLRGVERVAGEWSLVCLAYNVKRLCALSQPATA